VITERKSFPSRGLHPEIDISELYLKNLYQMKQLGRREFIKNTTIAGLGTTALGNEALAMSESKQKKGKKVIVAGAGIAGLCTAYELMKRGHDVTVL